jgi:site-specific DNA-methyltransferase (adenine-specific)
MTSLDTVLAGTSPWHIERGEALATLRLLPESSVDAVITDPPYSSGGLFAGDRAKAPSQKYVQAGTKIQHPDFVGDTRDQRSFAFWCALWLSECHRAAKEGAPVCVFSDWRQLPTTVDVLQAGGWVFRGIVPWDKTEGARPQRGRYRNQCEYVAWGSKGPMPTDRGVPVLPGVVRVALKKSEKLHLAGKPIDVMCALVRICPPGGIVLDPFAGSASTGVACAREGLRFIGIELTQVYADVARKRLRGEAFAAAA